MSFVKCFDVANMVIEDANERFNPLWKINAERLNIFKGYCDAVDSLSKEFDGESFEVEVDEITMEVTVVLECDEVIIEKDDHILYELAKRTVRYGFSVSEDGNLLVKFVFPGLWDKA